MANESPGKYLVTQPRSKGYCQGCGRKEGFFFFFFEEGTHGKYVGCWCDVCTPDLLQPALKSALDDLDLTGRQRGD